MTVRTAIKQGFGLARRARAAVGLLFLINLGLAALAALPVYRGILRFTGYSLMSQTLASDFSSDWLTDFSFNSPGSIERYARIILWMGLLSIPINTVLAGGVLTRFRHPEQRASLGDFFSDATRYAWRLTRLMIIGLVCYWIVFRLLNQGLGNAVEKRIRDSLDDRLVFWMRLGVTAMVLIGIGFVNLVMDYGRTKLVFDDGSSAIQAFLASLGFCLGRLRKALAVYVLPSLGGLALLGIYLTGTTWLRSLAHRAAQGGVSEPLMLALVFIGQQAIMFWRYWFRVATWASEWSYFASYKSEIRK